MTPNKASLILSVQLAENIKTCQRCSPGWMLTEMLRYQSKSVGRRWQKVLTQEGKKNKKQNNHRERRSIRWRMDRQQISGMFAVIQGWAQFRRRDESVNWGHTWGTPRLFNEIFWRMICRRDQRGKWNKGADFSSETLWNEKSGDHFCTSRCTSSIQNTV